jgi:hypothetical protein
MKWMVWGKRKKNPEKEEALWNRFVDRFHSRYTKGEGCWEWVDSYFENGYGRISFKGRYYCAHRIAYQLATGVVPEEIHHTCNNRGCVNPEHLLNTTHADNMQEKFYEPIK